MNKTTLDKIVESGKMPILFVGSGISKRYLYKYPDWENLLRDIFDFIEPDSFRYQKHYDELSREGLSPFEIYAKLGSYAESEFNAAFYDKKISFKVGKSKKQKWIRRGISPFKMFLSKNFSSYKLTRDNSLHEEIQKFRLLKDKVTAVITTNYDCFIEKEIFKNDFSVFVNQSELFSNDSYNVAEIYKIHGCVTDASSIVITENDYKHFNETRKLIIAKMLTLFTESPLIFMGYSLTDENIQNIVTDFLDCLSSAQLENIDNHFVFITYEKKSNRSH